MVRREEAGGVVGVVEVRGWGAVGGGGDAPGDGGDPRVPVHVQRQVVDEEDVEVGGPDPELADLGVRGHPDRRAHLDARPVDPVDVVVGPRHADLHGLRLFVRVHVEEEVVGIGDDLEDYARLISPIGEASHMHLPGNVHLGVSRVRVVVLQKGDVAASRELERQDLVFEVIPGP